MTTNCYVCNKEINLKPSKIKEKNFCSYECHHIYLKGKKHSKETKEKMRKSHIGKEPWNKGKTYEELYGESAEELKQKIVEASLAGRKKKSDIEKICQCCDKTFYVKYKRREQKYCCHQCSSNARAGVKRPEFSIETRKKMSSAAKGRVRQQSRAEIKNRRIRAIKTIEERKLNGQQLMPNWNPKACDYFDEFDKQNNTFGQHARNGGEYYIEELGYWIDYINHDLKLIMEYDERKHFDIDGNLLEKDKIRQEEIEEYFSDYEFKRIKDR